MKHLPIYLSLLLFLGCSKEQETPSFDTYTKYDVAINFNPSYGGSVSPNGGKYDEGRSVTFTVTPSQNYVFTNWSGSESSTSNPLTIVVDSNKTLTINFEKKDTDGDGFTDDVDQCPDIFGGEQVDGNGCPDPNSFTGLPIIYINTSGVSIESKDDYVNGFISISGIDNLPNLSKTDIRIKGRGNSTWWQGGIWGKKPYQIKFDDKTQVLNMPKDKKWVLLAEISDVSLIRNKIAREIANVGSFDYVPKAEYVELFLNGEHHGTYLIGQKVEESKNRVNIGDDGYLVEIDTDANGRIDPNDDVYFKSAQSGLWPEQNVFNIKEPGLDYNSDEFNLIINHVDSFEAALFSEDFKNPDSGYRAYIDLESFIDYYLVSEITKNQDAASYSSIYFTYVPSEKIKMGPIWDYDLAFGNVNYSEAEFPEGFWIKSGNPWFKRMFEDEYFKEAVRERFNYYYSNLGSFQSKIDEFQLNLSISQEKNFELYPGLLDPNVEIWPVPIRFYNHNGYVEYLKGWLNARMDWLNTWL